MNMESNLTKAIVHNEGCDLHYFYQGQGPLITFIPGGNGHARQFFNLMAALADKYTCVAFDRRQMSASQVETNRKLSPPQQARDIRAAIRAVGFDRSILFGSSSGGLFAYTFAHDFPDMVVHLIAHEAPTTSLLPEASQLFEQFLGFLEIYRTEGLDKVNAAWRSVLIGYDAEGVPRTAGAEPEHALNFWENEFPSLLGYTPNFWRIKQNGTSIGVMRGARCGDAFFAKATEEQAKVLGCPKMLVPGHHQGFEVETKEFLPSFLDMLDILEKKKRQEAVAGN